MFHYRRVLFAVLGMVIVGLMASYPFLRKIQTAKRKAKVKINDQVIVADVVNSEKKLKKGLSGKESLGLNEGMLFVFDEKKKRSVWMKNMSFAIDVIWISDRKIVGVTEKIPPQPNVSEENLDTYKSPKPVDKVLEVKTGRAQLFKASKGDEVLVKPVIPGAF
ncbi:MAG: DUF192 domain-containing protein [Candidatus Magasanikbacteria bacterium]